MRENVFPIFSRVPSNFAWWVDLDRHDLTDPTTLDQDYTRANTSILPAAIFASLDISSDKRITTGDVRSGDDMSARNGEKTIRIAVVVDAEFDK